MDVALWVFWLYSIFGGEPPTEWRVTWTAGADNHYLDMAAGKRSMGLFIKGFEADRDLEYTFDGKLWAPLPAEYRGGGKSFWRALHPRAGWRAWWIILPKIPSPQGKYKGVGLRVVGLEGIVWFVIRY